MSKQEPARSIQEASNDGETGGDSVTGHVARALVGWVQLAGDEIGDVGQTVSERLAYGTLGIWCQVCGNPCHSQG